jgi:hypothetical protein
MRVLDRADGWLGYVWQAWAIFAPFPIKIQYATTIRTSPPFIGSDNLATVSRA